jgi:hypothetical protein
LVSTGIAEGVVASRRWWLAAKKSTKPLTGTNVLKMNANNVLSLAA